MITIELDRASPLSPGQQIVDQVQLAVAAGRLLPGDRLDPVRRLARRLGLNASTVARAYRILEGRGILRANGRGGSVIAAGADSFAAWIDSPGEAAEAESDATLDDATAPGVSGTSALQPAGLATRREPTASAAPAGPAGVRLRDLRAARLQGLVERALVDTLAQGFTLEELAGACDLQLAAWRERQAAVAGIQGSVGPMVARLDALTGEAVAPERVTVFAQSDRTEAREARLWRFAGSHDLALAALLARHRRADPANALSASYVGSLDGLLALLHGESGLAGTHLLDEETGDYNLPALRRLFGGQRLCVVTLAAREQGLIVRPGNPLGLRSFADLARPGLRFVNRQAGSGTRALLDHGLRQAGIASDQMTGRAMVVSTHLAVAAAVAEGQADVGLGVAAAARACGQAFVPLASERYDLVLAAEDRSREPLVRLLDMIREPEFQASVAGLGGYDLSRAGDELRV